MVLYINAKNLVCKSRPNSKPYKKSYGFNAKKGRPKLFMPKAAGCYDALQIRATISIPPGNEHKRYHLKLVEVEDQ